MELRKRHPSIDIDCFSPIEIEGIADVTGLTTLRGTQGTEISRNAWITWWRG